MRRNKIVLVVGAGAIGATVAAWISPYCNLYVMDMGGVQEALKSGGITVYQADRPASTRHTLAVKTIDCIEELTAVDMVILAVKAYSIAAVAEMVHVGIDDRAVIVSMVNGTENQEILPRFFSRVIYCVVGFNARRMSPMHALSLATGEGVVVDYQKKGPLILGTLDNAHADELKMVWSILGRGCRTVITDRLQDAVHTKIVMNLTNAVATLLGHGLRPISNLDIYQKLVTNTLHEGARIIRAAGYREYRIGGMPSFATLWLSTVLPLWMGRRMFRRRIKAMIMSSMTQDVLLRGSSQSEIDSLTGYIVRLADRYKVPAPYNLTIYRLARERFGPGFEPMRAEEVMAEVDKTKAALTPPIRLLPRRHGARRTP